MRGRTGTAGSAGRRSALWSRVRRVWALLGVLATAGLFWTMQARGLPAGVLDSDGEVLVEQTATGLEFRPVAGAGPIGLLFFPGAMVQMEAYAPLARAIAVAGYPVVLVRLPFLGRGALTEGQKAEAVEAAYSRIRPDPSRAWVIAGHSLGGYLAARFAHGHPDRTSALVLIGTTHPRDLDLSEATYPVTRIWGSRDGVAPESRMRENAHNLPVGARMVAIEGGNHAQFGYYGPQLGDARATITRERQQRLTFEALVQVLGAVRDRRGPG